MKEELYKNLTDEVKLGLLHYIRGGQGLVKHEHYQTTDVNPTEIPRVEHLYISNILNIDFEEACKSNKFSEKHKKFKEQIREKAPEYPGGYKSSHIGDAIDDVFFVRLDIDINRKIDKDFMKEIDQEIKSLYNYYMDLGVKYVESEVDYNGEKLYRRIE